MQAAGWPAIVELLLAGRTTNLESFKGHGDMSSTRNNGRHLTSALDTDEKILRTPRQELASPNQHKRRNQATYSSFTNLVKREKCACTAD